MVKSATYITAQVHERRPRAKAHNAIGTGLDATNQAVENVSHQMIQLQCCVWDPKFGTHLA
jgi:hypothetical protein